MDRIIAVYIMTNQRNGTLYIGSTVDLQRRLLEHRKGLFDGFTKQYDLKSCVYIEVCENLEQALILERRYKKYLRAWKMALIEKSNPAWLDLADQLNALV